MNRKDRSNKSLCETSIKMVANFIRLSSFSIAKMSLGAAGTPAATKAFAPVTGSYMVAAEPLLSQIPDRQMSQEPQSRSKPISYLMQPGGENESSSVTRKEESVTDGTFADYIRKVHEKNRNDSLETSNLSPFILPPPPRVVK